MRRDAADRAMATVAGIALGTALGVAAAVCLWVWLDACVSGGAAC
jgi:hypothetical protein